jgi:hypothetical protein
MSVLSLIFLISTASDFRPWPRMLWKKINSNIIFQSDKLVENGSNAGADCLACPIDVL